MWQCSFWLDMFLETNAYNRVKVLSFVIGFPSFQTKGMCKISFQDIENSTQQKKNPTASNSNTNPFTQVVQRRMFSAVGSVVMYEDICM